MTTDPYRRKLHYRAHHRGTREADAIVGGFFDTYAASWSAEESDWFERLLEEQDVDIIGWATGTMAVPQGFEGPMMEALQRLDFVKKPGE